MQPTLSSACLVLLLVTSVVQQPLDLCLCQLEQLLFAAAIHAGTGYRITVN